MKMLYHVMKLISFGLKNLDFLKSLPLPPERWGPTLLSKAPTKPCPALQEPHFCIFAPIG